MSFKYNIKREEAFNLMRRLVKVLSNENNKTLDVTFASDGVWVEGCRDVS